LGILLSRLVYPAGERRLRPLHAAEHLRGSPALLLIYGEADVFTPVRDGQLLWQALRRRTSTHFWQVPQAQHTHAYAAEPEAYAQQVIGFLDEQLAGQQPLV
jgi:hypothetical protein